MRLGKPDALVNLASWRVRVSDRKVHGFQSITEENCRTLVITFRWQTVRWHPTDMCMFGRWHYRVLLLPCPLTHNRLDRGSYHITYHIGMSKPHFLPNLMPLKSRKPWPWCSPRGGSVSSHIRTNCFGCRYNQYQIVLCCCLCMLSSRMQNSWMMTSPCLRSPSILCLMQQYLMQWIQTCLLAHSHMTKPSGAESRFPRRCFRAIHYEKIPTEVINKYMIKSKASSFS